MGSLIDKQGHCASEIKRRLVSGRMAMGKLERVWKDRDISQSTKLRIVKTLVFPVATYGCETWTIKKGERRKITAFDMWCWRRMLRIPWTARRTNASTWKQLDVEPMLEYKIRIREYLICQKTEFKTYGDVGNGRRMKEEGTSKIKMNRWDCRGHRPECLPDG